MWKKIELDYYTGESVKGAISNDDAYANVMEAMTFIDTVKDCNPADARAVFHKLRATLEWIEIQVDGDWEDEGNQEVD
jgi:hypothetical protein